MANSFTSNVTPKLSRAFLNAFEKNRVVSKAVDVQRLSGEFSDATTGGSVYLKRPHQAVVSRTAAGDITSESASDIVAGQARASVQNYITVFAEWTEKDETLSGADLDKILEPYAEQCVVELETSIQDWMIKQGGLCVGTPGTAVDAWSDVASAASMLRSIGAPADSEMYYVMNPFTVQNLASAQSGLNSADQLVASAWDMNKVGSRFAGMQALASNSMSTFTSITAADRAGTLSAAPTVTYAGAKNTMTQTLAITGLTASATIKAGDIIEFTGTGSDARSYVHPRTQKVIYDETGSPVKWRCTVTADVALNGSGAGNVVVASAGIYESGGQYNNMDAALASGDAFSVLGSTGVTYQPSLFFHKQAFGMTTIPLKKLSGWDSTIATTKDGIAIRTTKYSDATTNKNKIRFDMLPAFCTYNPLWGGKAFGS